MELHEADGAELGLRLSLGQHNDNGKWVVPQRSCISWLVHVMVADVVGKERLLRACLNGVLYIGIGLRCLLVLLLLRQ